MDNVININGVEYIRKDAVNNSQYLILKENINNKLNAVHQEINALIDMYLDNEDIQHTIDSNSQVVSQSKRKEFTIFPSAKELYNNVTVYTDGSIKISGFNSKLNIDDIKEIKALLKQGITHEDVKELSQRFSIAISTLHKLLYNIQEGSFDDIEYQQVDAILSQRKPVAKKSRSYKKGTDIFTVHHKNAQLRYKIDGMDETGTFYINGVSNFHLNIHQVLKVKSRVCDKTITINRAKQIAQDIGISYNVLLRVAYNIDIGYFDKYIYAWNNRCSNINTSVSKPAVKIQNNPEKRREQGYYNNIIGY